MVFETVICGIDGTPEAVEAARQAARLATPEARLVLLEVVNPGAAAPAGEAITASVDELEAEAREALEQARSEIGRGELCQLKGLPVPTLLRALEREAADLVVLGAHHRSRAVGIVLGSVATAMLHDAPCSVLVARRGEEAEWFPRSIVAGLDGSPESRAALAAAREVAGRTGASLAALAALGREDARVEAIRAAAGDVPLVEVDRGPVDALVAADADLLVLGSRGLHGLRALGSVSERVAHRAPCSVLVVR